jgi:PTS system mannose-specific IIA component
MTNATGLLLITHDTIGDAMVETASTILEMCPMALEIVSVSPGCSPEDVFDKACSALRRLDRGGGVLILTDMFGSTPSNVINHVSTCVQIPVKVVAGLNLPMLLRVLNYPSLSLDELAAKAESGGKDGIFVCVPDESC